MFSAVSETFELSQFYRVFPLSLSLSALLLEINNFITSSDTPDMLCRVCLYLLLSLSLSLCDIMLAFLFRLSFSLHFRTQIYVFT